MTNSTATLTTETTITENYNGWKGEQLVKSVGGSYVPGRDVKDIAKDVRTIIRKAVKAGYLPKSLKASVTIERYSMGCALNVNVTHVDETIINVDGWQSMADANWRDSWVDHGGRHNDLGREILEFLNRVVSAFQRSEHHGQSDYCNVNFHGDVGFDSDLTHGQAKA